MPTWGKPRSGTSSTQDSPPRLDRWRRQQPPRQIVSLVKVDMALDTADSVSLFWTHCHRPLCALPKANFGRSLFPFCCLSNYNNNHSSFKGCVSKSGLLGLWCWGLCQGWGGHAMVVRRWSWLGRALPMVVILTLLWSVRSSDEIWFMLWVVILRFFVWNFDLCFEFDPMIMFKIFISISNCLNFDLNLSFYFVFVI